MKIKVQCTLVKRKNSKIVFKMALNVVVVFLTNQEFNFIVNKVNSFLILITKY